MVLQATIKRLLVVEDDPDQSRAVRERLELYGYAVSCAKDGRIAMQMLQVGAAFDGVLLDLNLPRVPGLQFLVATRQALPDVPVLVMATSLSRLQAVKASHLPCGYFVKPFATAQFKEAVRGCFDPAYQPAALSWNRIHQGGPQHGR